MKLAVVRFDAFLPYLSLINVVESAAAATRTPSFGRRLGERQGIEILGPIGVAARTGARVSDAFTIFEQYLAAYSTAITVGITTEGTSAFVEFKVVIEASAPPAALAAAGLRPRLLLHTAIRLAPRRLRDPRRRLESADGQG